MSTYIIRQKLTPTHLSDIEQIKYLSEKTSDYVHFSEDKDTAIEYYSIDEAKNALRKVFMRVPYHITIQYDIVKLD